MDDQTSRPGVASGRLTRRAPALLAGVSGCLFVVVWTSPVGPKVPPFLDAPGNFEIAGTRWWYVAVPVVATAAGLGALRWWPYLLVVAGLLAVPGVLAETMGVFSPPAVDVVATAGYPLAIIGVLASAQGLGRGLAAWAAVVTGLYAGAHLLGSAFVGAGWLLANPSVPTVHAALTALGLAGVLPAAWRLRRGDGGAIGLAAPAGWSWRRARPIVAGALAASLAIPLSFLTVDRLADLLGVPSRALQLREFAVLGMIGVVTLVAASLAASVAGAWSLAGALTVATAWVAVAAPMILAVRALAFLEHLRWTGVLAGVAVGAVAAGSRWRTPLAGALAVLAASTLIIAYAATSGHPEKLAEQRTAVPALLLLVAISAAATSVTAATAPVLASRGTLPAAAGPVAVALAGAGLQTVEVTYLRDGSPVGSYLNSVYHLPTSAILLLVAGAAAGGLGLARQFTARRAERRQAEEIQREAAAAERDRLARPIHDGVLQVLALVQRHGTGLGEHERQLATLAAEQEVALRTLLSGEAATGDARQAGAARRRPTEDLRASLRPLGSPDIEVVVPAEPVALPARAVAELTAAVRAALDNVRQHAGHGARAWVLVEDEGEAVRVTVRDNGAGFSPDRLAEAAAAGRLGVAQSMRGRITDLGGSTTIHSHPGEGTEVEFWVPRGGNNG